MVNLHPTSDEFRGFDEARSIMWCHEARARVHRQLNFTPFVSNSAVRSVHVDNVTRADRAFLTAFDDQGKRVDADTIFTDDASQRIDVTPEFDHDFTSMPVIPGSQLADLLAEEKGWVIDMRALRSYDLDADRRATQRAVFLAHLGDMMATGQIQGFLLDGMSGPDEPDAA